MAQLNDLTVIGKTTFLGDVYASNPIYTSWKNSVANGSYTSSATTVPNLLTEVRYSSGCMGSFNLGTAYTLSSATLSTGWYNFIWLPHRTGGVNGIATGDNCNYGSLILCGMTLDAFAVIRFSSGAAQSMHKWY